MFEHKVVLITGGSSGLGFGLAVELLKRGARVILLARNLQKLENVKEDLKKSFPEDNIDIISADVANYESLRKILIEKLDKQPVLDMVVRNAGVIKEGYFGNLSIKDFETVVGINYFGCLHMAHITLPYLKKSRGRLVNISSVAGLTGVFGYAPYCSSKHALVGLTESLRYELKPQGINVHLVCPPEFESPLVEELDTYRTPENRAHTLMIPKMGVETVVKDTLKGIEKNRFKIIPGWKTRVMVSCIQHLPGISRYFADMQIRRTIG